VVLEIHLKVPMNFSLGLTATVDAPNNNMDVILTVLHSETFAATCGLYNAISYKD
jgi:hypothetical protein